MKIKLVGCGIISGIASGLVIGMFFKWIETMSNVQVYTLLLNIDFIPVLNGVEFPESIEFTFHLIVSILLTIGLYLLFGNYHFSEKQVLVLGTSFNIFIGLIIYPITLLSDRTPEFTFGIAIIIWLFGHFIYGVALSLLYLLFQKVTSFSS